MGRDQCLGLETGDGTALLLKGDSNLVPELCGAAGRRCYFAKQLSPEIPEGSVHVDRSRRGPGLAEAFEPMLLQPLHLLPLLLAGRSELRREASLLLAPYPVGFCR